MTIANEDHEKDSDFKLLNFNRRLRDPALEQAPSTTDLQSYEALAKRSRSRLEIRCARRKTLLLNAENLG